MPYRRLAVRTACSAVVPYDPPLLTANLCPHDITTTRESIPVRLDQIACRWLRSDN